MNKSIFIGTSLTIFPFSLTLGAGMERTTQSVAAFLQPNHYFEAGINVLDPNVSGKIDADFNKGGLSAAANMDTGNIANHYIAPSAALKLQLTDHFSIGFLYDHPFGSDSLYPIQKLPAYTEGDASTGAKVTTQNLSTIVGYQPNENWNFYAGPVLQTVKGETHVRGAGYMWLKYDMTTSEKLGTGWLAGFAYSIPEIALKTSLTYRSEIDHDVKMTESLALRHPVYGVTDFGTDVSPSTVTTPQSINLDLQSGIMADTVAFANVRWVEWSKNKISPPKLYKTTQQVMGKGIDLVTYYEDQISANVGLGRKLNDHWGGSLSVGWDSGAGDPITTLGPTKGYWNVGVGFKFSPQPNYDIALGVKHFWLGDARAQSAADFGTNNSDAYFSNNTAWAYGLKIGYKF
ncbi:OmpP1/FadL family transporter [Acinetobacter baumannii]|uniref:OmpP1/FadL family transporter n=1 Tax=Acinetobacter TaxID=469 RepID=UPI000CCF5A25|nr:transporter [Acinetobacter sp. AKBS16]MDC5134388.1 transporter [Acinetobacter baumannii]PNW15984.1 transporter [Acinetobacter sp. AKBS16]